MPLEITQDVHACVQDIPLPRHPVKAPQRVRVATGMQDGSAAFHDVDVDIGKCSHDLLRRLVSQPPVEYERGAPAHGSALPTGLSPTLWSYGPRWPENDLSWLRWLPYNCTGAATIKKRR